ncbi:PREDICTED: C-type lectin domain family 6 member A isoform X2 [Rhinopithecus bieti]|uniref:C-type lectin domain family 6 member A isoform X2 n=1 Tax=Rhinopithecus bieti TaxID=61621 RepID=UPI00083C77DD|nr:PREDICTED: C-type lectin domain family 6 member A isoform X2 [Rhinopithecus bieti]
MMQERQPQSTEKRGWWSLRLWSVAGISIALLSACFIVSCVAWGCCPASWKSFGSSCYFISSEKNVWSESEQNCVEMGAHLVVFNTEAEQNFIVQQLNKSFSYFLGLSDPQGNNNWQWIDKTPFKKNVRFWHPNEPNHSAEKCASIVFWKPTGWGWNDVICETSRNSICEMNKIYL